MRRLAGALIDWTTGNITDLADANVQGLFRQILSLLLRHTFMAHLTVDLVTIEESLTDDMLDLDLSWSLRSDISSADDRPSTHDPELAVDRAVLYDFDSTSSSQPEMITPPEEWSAASTRTASTASNALLDSESRRNSSSHPRTGSSTGDLVSNRVADEGTSKWSGACGYVLTVDPKTFAVELTRMQWHLFTDIRVSGGVSARGGRVETRD